MQIFALPLFLLAAFGLSGVQAQAAPVAWPMHGVIKVAAEKSPTSLSIEMTNCFVMSIVFSTGKISAYNFKEKSSFLKEGGPALPPTGGQFVALFSMEEDRFDIIVTVETETKELFTTTRSYPKHTCNMDKLQLRPKEKDEAHKLHVYVSKEFTDAFSKKN